MADNQPHQQSSKGPGGTMEKARDAVSGAVDTVRDTTKELASNLAGVGRGRRASLRGQPGGGHRGRAECRGVHSPASGSGRTGRVRCGLFGRLAMSRRN